MKIHLRLLTLLIVLFLCYVSYKIIEPELYADSRDFVDIIGFNPQDDLEVFDHGSQSVESRVRTLLQMYHVDWHYNLNGRSTWDIAARWVSSRYIHPTDAPELGAILNALATAPIVSADVGHRGTQLKMTLVLEGGQKVVFKPKWYERNHVIRGLPYDGADRHNAEIASFHLGRLLGFNRIPLVAGRVVNLEKEIKPLAEGRLLSTFFYKDGNTCFYGRCHYCRGKEDGVCGDGMKLEGAVVLWLPENWHLSKTERHPWGRTYKDGVTRRWETDNGYCSSVVLNIPLYSKGPRLLDLMDACVFDYLIGNADRHHYETFKDFPEDTIMVMMDNGKGFGNPYHDEESILAPLTQCCMLRERTWRRLNTLRSGVLGSVMEVLLSEDPLSPIITGEHFIAMQRRLEFIIAAIHKCIQNRQDRKLVLINDGYS